MNFEEQVDLLKTKVSETESLIALTRERIEKKFQYVEEELEIRIESLKQSFDMQRDGLIKKCSVNRVKKKTVKRLRKTQSIDVSVLGAKLRKLKDVNVKFDKTKMISHDAIAEIAYICMPEDITITFIKNVLKCPEDSIRVDLDVEPYYLVVLPNDTLLTCNDKSFSIYNRFFKELKRVSEIDGHTFTRNFVSTRENRIYISYHNRNMIMMTDLDLNFIKFGGSNGSGATNFNYPRGTCVYKDDLYVCDHYNRRIQILTQDLEFKGTPVKLDYKPWQIRIHNDTACVTQFGQKGVYFYDVPSFTLKHYYENHMGTISLLNSHFYLYLHERQMFSCYNDQGELLDEFNFAFNYRTNIGDGYLVYYHGKIIISMISLKKLLVFAKY